MPSSKARNDGIVAQIDPARTETNQSKPHNQPPQVSPLTLFQRHPLNHCTILRRGRENLHPSGNWIHHNCTTLCRPRETSPTKHQRRVGGSENAQKLGQQGRRNSSQKPARNPHKPLSTKETWNKKTKTKQTNNTTTTINPHKNLKVHND